MIWPAATALTTRVTRTVPSASSTRTSQNTAEWEARTYFFCFRMCGSIRYLSSSFSMPGGWQVRHPGPLRIAPRPLVHGQRTLAPRDCQMPSFVAGWDVCLLPFALN